MTANPAPEALSRLRSEAANLGTTPYLVTVGEDARPHCSVVSPCWEPEARRLTVAAPGSWTRSEQAGHLDVTLLWPPPLAGGYSLIIDGTAAREDGVSGPRLALTITRAVLHRPGPGDHPGSPCAADCIQMVP